MQSKREHFKPSLRPSYSVTHREHGFSHGGLLYSSPSLAACGWHHYPESASPVLCIHYWPGSYPEAPNLWLKRSYPFASTQHRGISRDRMHCRPCPVVVTVDGKEGNVFRRTFSWLQIQSLLAITNAVRRRIIVTLQKLDSNPVAS